MNSVPIRFVISHLPEEDIEALKGGDLIITKMILTLDDYKLFQYRIGESIEVETNRGNRMLCTIKHLEIIPNPERIILIFTLRGNTSS